VDSHCSHSRERLRESCLQLPRPSQPAFILATLPAAILPPSVSAASALVPPMVASISSTFATLIVPQTLVTTASTSDPAASWSYPSVPIVPSVGPLDPSVSFFPWKLVPVDLPRPPRFSRTVQHKNVQTESWVEERGTQTSPLCLNTEARIVIEVQTKEE